MSWRVDRVLAAQQFEKGNYKEAIGKLQTCLDAPSLPPAEVLELQLLKALREFAPTRQCCFILVTGKGVRAMIEEGKKYGLNNFLAKPFTPDEKSEDKTEKKPEPKYKPFEEVKEKIFDDLLRERTLKLMKERIESVLQKPRHSVDLD